MGFSLIKKKKNLPEELHEGWSEEVVEKGYSSSESVGSASRGNCAHIKVKIEKADAAAASKKESTSLSLFLEVFGLEVKRNSLPWPRRRGQK